MGSGFRGVLPLILAGLLAGLAVPNPAGAASGSLVIAGHGPEFSMVERLARAFEKANPRAYLDIQWQEHLKPVEMVKTGQADIAVTGKEASGLKAAQIGWDGIAVMVNLSNHTKEVTKEQISEVFKGKVRSWADLGGPETKILLIDRPKNRNLRDAFEQYLGIAGQIPDSAKVIGPDDKAIKTVAGTLPPLSAVTYMSLGPAREAVSSGVAVRLLPVDKVEPEEPTVRDGRYKLRRPILFLTGQTPNPVADAFIQFTLSPEGQRIVDEIYTPVADGQK